MPVKELLQKAKESIAADPAFTMASWDHCLANHICRANGEAVKSDVHTRAKQLINYHGPEWPMFGSLFRCADDKETVYQRIDDYIASLEPEPELVGV